MRRFRFRSKAEGLALARPIAVVAAFMKYLPSLR